MMSASVKECPTKYVFEARCKFKASNALFKAEIAASSASMKKQVNKKARSEENK